MAAVQFSHAPLATRGSLFSSTFPATNATDNALSADPMQPLRAMADRVGKEVEEFAERLDDWYTHSNESEKAKQKATVKVLGRFRDLAEAKVRELKQHNRVADQGELDKSVRRRIKIAVPERASSDDDLFGSSLQKPVPSTEASATPVSSNVQELRNWQAELATWELVRVVFDHHHAIPGADGRPAKRTKVAKLEDLDRYSAKGEVWGRFILDDDKAREKKVVLEWLQQTALNNETNADAILTQWGEESGKDTNSWTNGWLDTKARIKQAKRMRGTDGPLPLEEQVVANDRSTLLVTQLDPDAPMRQVRALDRSDEFYENALWMVCYEMIRRGESWEKINEWLKERNESWRAVSIGASSEPQDNHAPSMPGNDFGYLYRRMTFLAARGARLPYEAAVFALRCGEVEKIKLVSRSWDDHLYAYYNALLLSRFDKFLLTEPKDRPLVQGLGARFNFPDVMQQLNDDWENATPRVIELLRQDKTTAAEARTPIKLIQSALIEGSFETLIHKVGIAIADWFKTKSRSTLIVDPDAPLNSDVFSAKGDRSTTSETYHQAFLQDPHALRILVHVFILLYKPRDVLDKSRAAELFARGNVIAAYLEFLRSAGRMQIIPLYASHIERWRAGKSLARILPDITNSDKQENYINLMNRYQVDIKLALQQHLNFVLDQTDLVTGSTHRVANQISRYRLLERSRDDSAYAEKWWPDDLHVADAFDNITSSEAEDAVIQSTLWYEHEGNEEELFELLRKVLTIFLLNGRVGAAEKLITEMSIEKLSLARTPALCGYSFDFTQPSAEQQDKDAISQQRRGNARSSGRDSLRPSEVPSPAEHREEVERLRALCQPYHDLSQFVRVISLLRQWREIETSVLDPQTASGANEASELKSICKQIESTMTSIFEPFYDPYESADIWPIYKAYLPEIILAYLSVLHSGALMINRDLLVKAMNVSVTVADAHKPWLQLVFSETKRMRELMDVFADISKTSLSQGELERGESKTKIKLAKKRGSKGETLRIWDLNMQS